MRRTGKNHCTVLAVAVQLCVAPHVTTAQVPGGAQAEPDADRLKRAEITFREGAAAFDQSDFARALDRFRESFALWPRSRTLLNIAVTLKKLGRLAEAANLLAEYADAPTSEPDLVVDVKAELADLDRELGRLMFQAPTSTPIEVDGTLLASTARRRALRVAPGTHTIAQRGAMTTYEIARGEAITIPSPIEPSPMTPSPPPPSPSPSVARPVTTTTTSSAYLWAGAGTLIAGGVTAYFGLRYRDAKNDLDRANANRDTSDYGFATDAHQRAQDEALRTNIGLGVTAVGLLTTAVLFAIRTSEQTTLRVSLVPGNAGVLVNGAFD